MTMMIRLGGMLFLVVVTLHNSSVQAASRYPPQRLSRTLHSHNRHGSPVAPQSRHLQMKKMNKAQKAKKDKGGDDDDDESKSSKSPVPTMMSTRRPTSTPSFRPSIAPVAHVDPNGSNTEEEALPTVAPVATTTLPGTGVNPTDTKTAVPTATPRTTLDDNSNVSPIAFPLQTFALTVSWTGGFVAVETIREAVQTDLETHLATIFSDSFDALSLVVDQVSRRRRLQQDPQRDSATLDFSGEATFDPDSTVTQDDVWTAQATFLQSYQLPATGNARIDAVSIGDTTRPAVETDPDDIVDSDGNTVWATDDSSDNSFSAYPFVVGALAAGTLLATMGGIYFIRRASKANQNHASKSHQNNGAKFYDVDPEDSTMPPPGSVVLGAKAAEHSDLLNIATLPTQSPKSEDNSEYHSDSDMDSYDDGHDPYPLSQQMSTQSSLVSGILTSVAEESSCDMVSEASTTEYLADASVDNGNLDVSVMADADEEFAAVSAEKANAQSTQVVDPSVYSGWVGPLLRRFQLSRINPNVADTSLPDDLMVSDTELDQQQKQQQLEDFLNTPEDPESLSSDKPAHSDANSILRQGSTDVGFPEDHDEEDKDPLEAIMHESSRENSTAASFDSDVAKSGNPLGIYSAKQSAPRAIGGQRSTTPVPSEESSINLSRQASFVSDDLDAGADLLDKALRDVTVFNPDETQDSQLLQVSEYLQRVNEGGAQEPQPTDCDKNPQNVAL